MDFILPGIYTSNKSLKSDATINPEILGKDNFIIFRSGESIILQPGFHARAGASFTAEIGLCKPPTTLNDTDTSMPYNTITTAIEQNRLESPLKNSSPTIPDFQLKPNPFNNYTNVIWVLPENREKIQIHLFNQVGQSIQALVKDTNIPAGKYQWMLEANNLQAGIYFISLITEKEQLTKKLILVK